MLVKDLHSVANRGDLQIIAAKFFSLKAGVQFLSPLMILVFTQEHKIRGYLPYPNI